MRVAIMKYSFVNEGSLRVAIMKYFFVNERLLRVAIRTRSNNNEYRKG